MARLFFFLGSLLAGISVVMGAWGAHSNIFDEVQMLWIDKGVRYQMFHSLALLVSGLVLATHRKGSFFATLAGLCFLTGTILFSGSLYFMAISSYDAGYLTPVGGLLFIIGWIFLGLCAPAKK